MSKKDYMLKVINKKDCEDLLHKYHYLTNISRGFKSGSNYGLLYKKEIVGVCIFTGLPVPELAKGMFGLDRTKQNGLYELSRLVLHPDHQAKEHNLASWFVSRAIKSLRKNNKVKAVLSYADNDYHDGVVYKALGFSYYGLTDQKSDFWIKKDDGTYVKHSRGSVKNLEGEWRKRSQKHRFLKVFDNNLTVKWNTQRVRAND